VPGDPDVDVRMLAAAGRAPARPRSASRRSNSADIVHRPPSQPDRAADESYVIRTGIAALDRLELLARPFWPMDGAPR